MKSENLVRRPVDRRGIVLILALGMLALFTVVAITLASISRTQATAAGNFKRLEQYGSNTLTVRPEEVTDLFRYALNQLVYDTRNRQSAIRGHSLLRDMYGSPTTYSLTTAAKIPVPAAGNNKLNITALTGVGNDGAELRLKKEHLQVLLNIDPTYNDPRNMALDYQKVYNGTGVFPPRKINFTGANFIPGTGVTGFENLYLSNPEIASQYALMNVPGRLMPTTTSFYPSNSADWKSVLLSPFGAVPTGAAYWLPLFPINYTEFDAFSPNGAAITRLATGASIDPERFTYVSSILGTPRNYPQGDHWFGADEDYDYPDINNMFLAMERADGKMLIPSFHRPGIIAQVADGVNTLTSYGAAGEYIGKLPWLPYNSGATSGNPPADFHGLVLRPRAADRDPRTLGISSPRAGRFREMADVYNGVVRPATGSPVPGQDGLPDDLDGSGFIGDHPTELDVDTDGDGQNDSVWVDIGAPVIQVGDSAVKPLFAFKVIGMDGKINLNTAGNLYKAPNPSYTATGGTYTNPINYTLQHKSNLGASPTEINPQYAMILGDNGGPTVWAMGNVRPPSPIWGFLPGGPTTLEPYQRLLVGYQNLYTGDQAPGRWTGTLDTLNLPGISSADDNGNLMKLDVSSSAKLAQSKSFVANPNASPPYTPDFSRPFEYSAGDGADPVSTTPGSLPAGLPDMVGAFSPVDLYGVGSKYSPYSYAALNPAHVSFFGLTPGEGNLLSAYLNYPMLPTSLGTTIGGHLKQLNNDTAGAAIPVPNVPTASGLPVERFITNEPTETNVYYPSDDYLFTAADIAALLRANDFDATANQSRLTGLLPDQLGRRPIEISAGATTASPVYYSPENYGRRRMQNFFTHESWDLIRYSSPPTFHSAASSTGLGNGLFLGPSVAGSPGELFDISGDTTKFANNPVEAYLARSHSGGDGPNFISQLLSYKLPTNTGGNAIAPAGPSYSIIRDVYEQLALTKTTKGDDFLIPYEVQMGRRLDLNRPLTGYSATGGVSPTNVDSERESFAQQIYVLLALASGACGIDPTTTKTMPQQARYAQARTIAQIAVNIVDYIDPDSVMTLMRFDPDLSDGWDDPTTTTKALVDSTGSNTIVRNTAPPPTPPDDFKSITTVIGFELPQLVINESLTVLLDDNSGDSMNPIRDEYQFTWVELYNPWPSAIDPVSNTSGVSLNAAGESVFVVQINRVNAANPANPDGSDTPPNPPIFVKDPSNGMSQLILFKNDGDPGQATEYNKAGNNDGTGAQSVSGRDYFLIGPSTTAKTMKSNKTVDLLASLTPKYTAAACGTYWKNATSAVSTSPQIDVKLYRKRNPFDKFNIDTNPYIVIDSLSQQLDDIESVRPFDERNLAGEINPPASRSTQKTGVYFIKDPNVSDNPPNTNYRPVWAQSAPQPTDITKIGYLSWQRRQPWHGFNGDWQPYLPATGKPGEKHPLYGSIFGKANQNLEGAFLGLPSLADPRRNSKATSPSGTYTNYYTTDDDTNGMRQNGFVPAAQSLGVSNPVAYTRWETFPFLNRQLATPLELLSVRLYGSHLWYLSGGSILEWKLRFTDDFEYFPHPWYPKSVTPKFAFFERMWRSRQVPWYQDSRLTHPTFLQQAMPMPAVPPATTAVPAFTAISPLEAQLPLPHLYRFFELVECRSRMNNGIPASQQWTVISTAWPTELSTSTLPTLNPGRSGSIAPPALPAPTTVLATQRAERTPGKINLNLITDEEVYRALLDSVETAYYDLTVDFVMNQTRFATAGNYSVTQSINYWPTNYWWTTTATTPTAGSLFSPLGQAPLGNPGTSGSPTKVLDVVDALGRMVAWSSLTLNNTTSVTVTTPPLSQDPVAAGKPQYPISTGGFDIGIYRLAQTVSSPPLSSIPAMSTILASGNDPLRVTPIDTLAIMPGSPNRQFPGIVIGADPNYILYPGTDPNRQVHSEMYRAFLLSRSGPDGIHGTADDKPFRSYASDDVSDTILRVRNSATNGLVKEGAAVFDGTNVIGTSSADAQAIVAKSYLDGSDDLVSMTTPSLSFYAGEYITRLGGQRAPGLFDPIPDPYSDYVSPTNKASIPHLLPLGADPNDASGDFVERLPTLDSAGIPQKLPADYWVLEERRNELLAKISGNVTTRSHVFAVWVAVGFFRVEPGTEGLKVPLLGAEVGSESGKAFRHRAFFIIDRSQAKSYDPEDIDANFDFDIMRQKKLLEYYKIIE